MRKVLVALAVLLGVLVGFVAISMLASESGEVVVLHTTDAAGDGHETRLWIVEHAGSLWLRAGSPDNAWLAWLREHPVVEVERAGRTLRYEAVPMPGSRDEINDALREKYGLADRWIDWTLGREDAVPIRLDPRPAG